MNMSKEKIIGNSYPVKDANLKVTGQLKYVGDMKLPNMLYGKMLLSPVAHANIKSIDISEALKVPGVRAIATCFNTPQTKYNSALRFYEHDIPNTEVVFPQTVRFVGDRVAAVAAETEKAAKEAIKLIKVEYEELPVILDVEEAIKEEAIHIHSGGNKVIEMRADAGDVDKAFKECDRIFEDRYEVPPIHHGAIETHVAIAQYDYTDKLTLWAPTQNTFAFRILLSQIMNIPLHKVRVIRPTIGGAFGGKLEMTIEPVAAILSKMTRRPVKLVLDRTETIISTRARHSAVVYIKTGVEEDGTILAQDIKMYTNTGAYASSALNVMGALSHKIYKVYKIPNMRFRGIPVYTNTITAGAMRGYGSPQVFMAQQTQLGKISRELNIDLVELQKRNAVEPSGVDQRFNSPLGNPRVLDCIEKGRELFKWDEKKKAIGAEDNWVKGIGMAIGAHGNGVFGAHRDVITLILKLNEDGTLTLITGTHDMGNGTVTMQTQMIAEVLGITPDKVETFETDTDACAWNLGDYASRGVFVEGAAAKKTAEKLKQLIISDAMELLEVEEELELIDGFVVSKSNPEKKVSLSDIAVNSQRVKNKELTVIEDYASPAGLTSYGAHFAEVLVNKETREIKVIDFVAVHDVGRVINPMSLEGQLEGGIQMGLGYALSEGYVFDEKGKPLNNNFFTYKMFRATDMPKITTFFIEELEEKGPYGAKSIGECAVVPVAPAICNAVADALNIDINQLPIKIKRGV